MSTSQHLSRFSYSCAIQNVGKQDFINIYDTHHFGFSLTQWNENWHTWNIDIDKYTCEIMSSKLWKIKKVIELFLLWICRLLSQLWNYVHEFGKHTCNPKKFFGIALIVCDVTWTARVSNFMTDFVQPRTSNYSFKWDRNRVKNVMFCLVRNGCGKPL